MNERGVESIASDWIDERTRFLFETKRLGNLACFNFEELEHLLRNTYACGKKDMAQQCAEAIHESASEVAPISPSSDTRSEAPAQSAPGRTLADVGRLLDEVMALASKASQEEAEWE